MMIAKCIFSRPGINSRLRIHARALEIRTSKLSAASIESLFLHSLCEHFRPHCFLRLPFFAPRQNNFIRYLAFRDWCELNDARARPTSARVKENFHGQKIKQFATHSVLGRLFLIFICNLFVCLAIDSSAARKNEFPHSEIVLARGIQEEEKRKQKHPTSPIDTNKFAPRFGKHPQRVDSHPRIRWSIKLFFLQNRNKYLGEMFARKCIVLMIAIHLGRCRERGASRMKNRNSSYVI